MSSLAENWREIQIYTILHQMQKFKVDDRLAAKPIIQDAHLLKQSCLLWLWPGCSLMSGDMAALVALLRPSSHAHLKQNPLLLQFLVSWGCEIDNELNIF